MMTTKAVTINTTAYSSTLSAILHNQSLTNNTLTNKTDKPLYNIPVFVIVMLMVIILIVGVLGNSIVVLIVVKKRRMQTVTNWLILNLAVADLSSTLICIPLEIPMEIRHGTWLYGKHFCIVFYPIQTITIYGSVFTLVALSLTRYWAIIHPFKRQPTVKMAKILIGVIWICSGLVVLPYFLVLKYNSETNSCDETWTLNQRRTYTIAIFVFQYVLPLSVISLAYVCIVYDLSFRKQDIPAPKDKEKENETKKVVNLLLIITITFAVCILPYHLVALFSEFGKAESFAYYAEVSISSYMLLYMNSAMNPIMYNVFNAKFRESYLELYKTIYAYVCCHKNENSNQVGFFSSRRPSVINNVRRWSKASTTRSYFDSSTSSSATVVFSPCKVQGKKTSQYLTADYNASHTRNVSFGEDVHLFPAVEE